MEARKRAMFEELQTAVAALYCVSSSAQTLDGRPLRLDETFNIPSWCNVDSITSQVLDALAAICVSEPDSAYAVTYGVDGSTLKLLIASNLATGVSVSVVRHLEQVWAHMRLAGSAGDSHNIPFGRDEFLDELYSFAWPALRHRVSRLAPVIARVLDTSTAPSEGQEATFCSIRALVETLRTTILDNDHDEFLAGKVHAASVALRELLAQKDVVSVLEGLCEFVPGAPNIAADICSIVRISSAADCLVAFRSSDRFTSMASLQLHVLPIASCNRTTLANADLPQLRKEGARAYIDPMMSNPEPNFDADFTSTVLQPLHRCLVPLSDGSPRRVVAVHAESVLLAYIESFGKAPYSQFIGTSEPSCLPCYRLFEAHNSALSQTRWMFTRGTTSRAPLLWVPPDLSSPLFVIRATRSLWRDLEDALLTIRKQRRSLQLRERQAQGQTLMTREEEEYRAKSRRLDAFCSLAL